jgi:RNA polymerase sigma factor (sigma-70 family)
MPLNTTEPLGEAVRPDDRGELIARLLAEARGGNNDAFREVMTMLSPRLWQAARATGLSREDARDVVQTVWERLLTNSEDVRTAKWLMVTTVREAWKVRAKGLKHVAVDGDWFSALPDPVLGCEEQVVADDQRRALWEALGQLSPVCRELLRIVAFVPRPDYGAVAAELGMKRGSVGPTRGRCLAKLRTILLQTPEE